ncbi:hypothetical protein [Roseospira visakhapatnamensis]|uniref:Uncharacterized protein n=1 Tax=Roseospira visakhapatnamensis TaxID=390880 RepID=A0A7W6RGQ2_9PROT|nr:hypothetical protein [Roseospira visakhapatnamensis]MBB4267719.1 hypothetical protein [Roseospira visakhapatnamensis]
MTVPAREATRQAIAAQALLTAEMERFNAHAAVGDGEGADSARQAAHEHLDRLLDVRAGIIVHVLAGGW